MNETWCVVRGTCDGTRTTHHENAAFMKIQTISWLAICSLSLAVFGQTKPLYENNFETAAVGKVPEDFWCWMAASR